MCAFAIGGEAVHFDKLQCSTKMNKKTDLFLAINIQNCIINEI